MINTPKPDRVCQMCDGRREYFHGERYHNCPTCHGTGKAPSIASKVPLASVDAAPGAHVSQGTAGTAGEIHWAHLIAPQPSTLPAAPDAGPTPRTDSELRMLPKEISCEYVVTADFARTLETELAAARGVVAAAVALLEAVVAYVTAPGEFAEAPFDEKPITAFLAELKGQKL